MHEQRRASLNADDLRIAIVVSRYHDAITGALRDGAVEAFTQAGGNLQSLTIVEAPGSFELPAICATLANLGRHDAIVAVGCVLSGETTHDQHISQAVAQALAHVSVTTGVPVAFGVLTCQTIEQARARAGGAKGNKGREAMQAAIEAAATIRRLVQGRGLPA